MTTDPNPSYTAKFADRILGPLSVWGAWVQELFGVGPAFNPGLFQRQKLFDGGRRVIPVALLDAVSIVDIPDIETIPTTADGKNLLFSPDDDQVRILGKEAAKVAFIAGGSGATSDNPAGVPYCMRGRLDAIEIVLSVGGTPVIRRGDYVVAAARQLGVEKIAGRLFYS